MTLAEFAILVDADPKWVLNARPVLGRSLRYTLPVAEQLAIARLLQDVLRVPLADAWRIGGQALAAVADGSPVHLPIAPEGTIALEIDVHRLRSAMAVRRSRLRTMHQPRRAGRPRRKARSPIRAAEQHGLDLSLLRANLERTPEQRLRQLDGMVAFRQRVRRKAAS